MRLSTRLLANPTTVHPAGSSPLRSAPVNLLPPIPLYRRLLRAHRKHLGPEERLMGDMYIKSEFRAHRNVDNPMHIIGFLTEWQMYAQLLEGDSWKGEKMDKAKIDKMSDKGRFTDSTADEQLAQLYELMQAIQKQADDDSKNDGQK